MSLFDKAAEIHRSMVRDILRWPEWKFSGCLMAPESIAQLRAERAAFLETDEGKRVLATAKKYKELIR